MKAVKHFIQSGARSEWITEGTLLIYVRKSLRYHKDSLILCFDIATINNEEFARGKGQFKGLLLALVATLKSSPVQNIYAFQGIYIENVLNPRLAIFIEKMGFVRTTLTPSPTPCYLFLLEETK